MKSIVVHIGLDNGQEARYRVAVDIARAFDGHLTCIQPATPVDAYMPIDPFGGAAFSFTTNTSKPSSYTGWKVSLVTGKLAENVCPVTYTFPDTSSAIPKPKSQSPPPR